ncbi:urea ABC transporter permease [Fredinandcohnia salidurans]|uniref:Urea ABC transporter permease n=1 Tax=Fredinandcohnia salidurans TaxID=2595041 RepID=A0ABW4MUZ1_9BACI
MNRLFNQNINSEKIIMLLMCAIFLAFPLIGSDYDILNMSYFISMAILSISLWLIWGLTGIFSFGQTALFGLGGYTYALISLNFDNPNLTFLALLLALIVTWAFSFLLGYFMFYGGVNDVFVGLITLCVTLVMATFLAQSAGSEWKIGDVLLGGDNGINNIPPLALSFGDFELLFTGNVLYYFIIISIITVYLILKKMQRTKLGYSFIAIRENRERSKLLGYNTALLQTFAFSLGGVLAAFSGVLYVTWGGYIAPSVMAISAASLPVVLVAAAGRRNLSGVIIFTILYYYLSQKLSVSGSEYALIILGFILITVILVVPQGIVVWLFNIIDRSLLKKRGNKLSESTGNPKKASSV